MVLQKWTPSLLDKFIILSLSLIVIFYGWLYQGFAQDDAFITYRYAHNLVSGHGFVYNLNEPVLGTTTPFYSIILAMVALISGQEIRLISHLISSFSLWGAGLLLYYLGRNHNALWAGATAVVFITNPLLISAIGMETFFLLFLLLLTLQSYLAGKFKLAGILLGLLILTRYETAIFGGILGVHFFTRRKQLPFWLILSALLVAIWLAFAWYRFGNLIPNSAQVKLVEKEGYAFATGLLIWWAIYANQSFWYYALAPLILLGSYTIIRFKKLTSGYALILIWTIMYFSVASLVAGSFSWYYGPLMPGLAILIVWGVIFGAQLVGQLVYLPKWNLARSSIAAGLSVLVIGGLLMLQIFSAVTGWVKHEGRIIDSREILYRDIVEWLQQNADHNQSLAAGEIGILGYYSHMRIIDLRGLVTPSLLPALLQGRVATLKEVMASYKPDYLLTDEEVLIKAMLHYPHYRPVQTFREGTYILYKRQAPDEKINDVKIAQ